MDDAGVAEVAARSDVMPVARVGEIPDPADLPWTGIHELRAAESDAAPAQDQRVPVVLPEDLLIANIPGADHGPASCDQALAVGREDDLVHPAVKVDDAGRGGP